MVLEVLIDDCEWLLELVEIGGFVEYVVDVLYYVV